MLNLVFDVSKCAKVQLDSRVENFVGFKFKQSVLASNMLIWPSLSTLTGNADINTSRTVFFTQLTATFISNSYESVLELTFLLSLSNLSPYLKICIILV